MRFYAALLVIGFSFILRGNEEMQPPSLHWKQPAVKNPIESAIDRLGHYYLPPLHSPLMKGQRQLALILRSNVPIPRPAPLCSIPLKPMPIDPDYDSAFVRRAPQRGTLDRNQIAPPAPPCAFETPKPMLPLRPLR